jgi:hypothetical protein
MAVTTPVIATVCACGSADVMVANGACGARTWAMAADERRTAELATAARGAGRQKVTAAAIAATTIPAALSRLLAMPIMVRHVAEKLLCS